MQFIEKHTCIQSYINCSERATQHSMIIFLLSLLPTTDCLPPLGYIVMTKKAMVHKPSIFGEAVSASLGTLLTDLLLKPFDNSVLRANT